MFFRQFGLLFTGMEWFVAFCFAVGIACLLIECIKPGFGFFGITGIISLVLAIVLRAIFHKEEDVVLMQVFQFVLLDVLIGAFAAGIIALADKLGWLSKSPLSLKGTAVDENFSDGTKNYSDLLGKEGVTVTLLRPSGKIRIGEETYDAESDGTLIERGTEIVVTAVCGGIIKVQQKINNNDKGE